MNTNQLATIQNLGFDRALVLREHWCDSILFDQKIWEMRSTKTNYRGVFGLIKSGTGMIVGKAELVDSLDLISLENFLQHAHKHKINRVSIETQKWLYPWVIADAQPFQKPISYKHPNGAVVWVKLTNDMLD